MIQAVASTRGLATFRIGKEGYTIQIESLELVNNREVVMYSEAGLNPLCLYAHDQDCIL